MLHEFDGATWGAGTQVGAADCIFTISGCGSMGWINESADLVSLDNGDWLVVWEDLINPYINADTGVAGQIGWVRQTSGVWGTAATIFPAGPGATDQVRLARGPDGIIWLAFRRFGGEVQLAQYDGTAWDPSFAEALPLASSYPRIFMTIDGYGHGVVGSIVDGAGIEFRLKQFRHTDPIGAIVAAPYMQPQPVQGWARGYGMAIAKPDGSLAAAWRSNQWGAVNASELEGNVWE
jgi:hypothetical protein